MNAPITLAELLEPYRTAAITEALGITRDTVKRWRNGSSCPAADKVTTLAEFLRVDVRVVLDAMAAQRREVVA